MSLLTRSADLKQFSPDEIIGMIGDFEITYSKSHVRVLVEKLESLNFGLTQEVNKLEADLIQERERV